MMQGKLNSTLFKLALILLFALALRVIFWHGISPSDPFTYSLTAWDIVQGKWNPAYFYEQTTRWGLLFPLAASYKLFGVNEASSMLWPLLTSLGTVVVAYLMAFHLKDERAATLAGIIVATFPLEIIYASQPMADCPLSFWLLLSLYLFLRADHSAAIRIKRWLYLASGFALALAYATKFVAVLIAPFFLLVLLLRRRIEWNWGWFVLGFALVFAFEFPLFRQIMGNGLTRLDLVLHDKASNSPITAGGFQAHNGVGLYLYWMFVDFHYVGLSFLALLLMLLHRIVKHPRYGKRERPESQHTRLTEAQTTHAPRTAPPVGNSWLPFLWSLTLFLMLSFYPTSTKPYVPLYKIEVYMLMFSAPLLVLTAVWLSEYARKWQGAMLALIVLSSLPFVYLLCESYRAHSDNTRAIFAFYQAHRDRPLYAHRGDQRLLQYFDRFQHNEAHKSFRLAPPEKELHPAAPIDFNHTYVAINQYLLDYYREDIYPAEILNPPANWRVIYTYQRPEHWLRKIGLRVAGYLQTKGWVGQSTYQAISGRFRNWSHTKPVVIYSADWKP